MTTDFTGHVQDYLRLRRGLGFTLRFEGQVLPQLADYLHQAAAPTLTADLAVAWAGIPTGVEPITLAHRLGAARGFARYLATIDPATEIPPLGIWPSTTPRPAPYLWSPADIAALLAAARNLPGPLHAATHETVLGLLAATGLRVGEALGLARGDVDLATGVLRIRHAKLDRERLVPLHPTVTDRLRDYAAERDASAIARRCPAFFVNTTGNALKYHSVQVVFTRLTTALGLRTASAHPRLHDLRHAFAVRTLIDWYTAGVDVDARMPTLSTYLGHVNPTGTYWYLTAAPELMDLAAARLDAHLAGRP